MAEAIPFIGVNKELNPDPGNESYSIPVLAKGNDWVSCWVFDKEELAVIAETGRVWLRLKGKTHPYVVMDVEEPIVDK